MSYIKKIVKELISDAPIGLIVNVKIEVNAIGERTTLMFYNEIKDDWVDLTGLEIVFWKVKDENEIYFEEKWGDKNYYGYKEDYKKAINKMIDFARDV